MPGCGLTIAVVISLLVLIARASAPKLSVLGRVPDGMNFSDVRRHPENRTLPGLLVVRPNEGLFFANAASLTGEIQKEVRSSDPPAQALLLDLEMTSDLDVPSLDALAELKEELAEQNVDLMLARVHEDVREILEHSGVLDKIGADNMHPYVLDGVLEFLALSPQTEETLKAHLSDNVRALIAGATALLERGTGAEGTESE